jgi:capsular polysaccharide transport system permease protein
MTELSVPREAEEGSEAPPQRVENAGYAKASPLVFQYRVIKAIVLRELSSRSGNSRAGPLLQVLMPILTLSSIILMFGFRGKMIPSAFPLAVFVITGYPLWQNFSGTYSKVMNTASRSDPLLMFPQITQLDLILATIILEWATNSVVFFLLCLGVVFIFGDTPPADPLGVIFCFWGCIWIGSAVGMILCGLQRTVPLVAQFLNIFMRFGMWVSGVLYSVNKLPSFLWPYLKWNPLLHLIEGCRAQWNPDFDAPIWSPAYVVLIGFILTVIGLVVERVSRRFVG